MTAYQKLIEQFQHNVPLKKLQDGFESSALRHSIINAVRQLDLPFEPPKEIYHKLNPEDKTRIGYLSQCSRAGGNACVELLKQNLAFKENCCYLEYTLAGAAEIGCEIGLEYGRVLYPELRKMRDMGVKLEKPLSEPAKTPGSYGFSVFIYKDYHDLEEIQFQPVLPQSELTYDGINERYIEFHSFPDSDQANAAHRKWHNYIHGKIQTPPVKYGFEIISDPVEGKKVYPVMPLDISARKLKDTERELHVYNTFAEALEQSRLANIPEKSPAKEPQSHSKQKRKERRRHQPAKPPVTREKSEQSPKKKSNAKSFGFSSK
jgi:hypothetical protein